MRRALAMALLLGGCAPTAEPVAEAPAPPTASGKCTVGDPAMRDLVGRAYTAEVGAELLRRAQAATLRVIRPGDAVTMDFREDRLNVELDAKGAVAAYCCG